MCTYALTELYSYEEDFSKRKWGKTRKKLENWEVRGEKQLWGTEEK